MELFQKTTVNTDILNSILDCFGDITGIIGEFCVNNQEELIYSSKIECIFCHHIRKNPVIDQRCRACDKSALDIVEKKKGIHIYQCHLGFWEAIVPLFQIMLSQGILFSVISKMMRISMKTGNDRTGTCCLRL